MIALRIQEPISRAAEELDPARQANRHASKRPSKTLAMAPVGRPGTPSVHTETQGSLGRQLPHRVRSSTTIVTNGLLLKLRLSPMARRQDDGSRPRLFQAQPDRPVFRGIPAAGRDVLCSCCDGVVLLERVGDDAVFDVDVVCAGCGTAVHLPRFPPGRGLGGVVRRVRRDHHFVGTFPLEMDEVVVGPHAARQRASETGNRGDVPDELRLDIAGIERLIADARSAFEPVFEALEHRSGSSKHPLPRLIRLLQENLDDLRAGGCVVDVRTAMSLQRATGAFTAWAGDPSTSRILQESTHPEGFDHNTALLQVASMLEATQLGPELVPPSRGRTADLILRVSASHAVDVDIKAPRALRFPSAEVIEIVEPRRTIRKALRSSRGQFAGDGILVIAGEIWFGGIDAYAQAAEHLLSEQLPDDASPEARAHYEQLLGIIFASTGYEELGARFEARLFMRWVPNPGYAGEIALELPRDLHGPFSIAFWPGPKGTKPPDKMPLSPAFDTRRDPARFRVLPSNEVEVVGAIVNEAPESTPSRSVVWQFAAGHRPSTNVDFDVACEAGFTTVTVQTDGSLLADPSVGWIDLRGVRFTLG
jgi:SAM-dependent methyltransferase